MAGKTENAEVRVLFCKPAAAAPASISIPVPPGAPGKHLNIQSLGLNGGFHGFISMGDLPASLAVAKDVAQS